MNEHLSSHIAGKGHSVNQAFAEYVRRVAFNISMTRTQIRTFTLFIRGQDSLSSNESLSLINKGLLARTEDGRLISTRAGDALEIMLEEAGLISKTTAPVIKEAA
jgi:hypothetical protein